MAQKKKPAFIPGEKWVTLHGHRTAYGERYAISNHGRLVKFSKQVKDGTFLKCSRQEGYPIWRRRKNGEHFHVLLHRLVAKYFLPKHSRNQTIVIHLNFKKPDNHYRNLKWATMEEAIAHQQNSPTVKKARKIMRENIGRSYNAKLTAANVRNIKTLLIKGKTLKEIAVRFGISDMQVHRIKTGENWGHVR